MTVLFTYAFRSLLLLAALYAIAAVSLWAAAAEGRRGPGRCRRRSGAVAVPAAVPATVSLGLDFVLVISFFRVRGVRASPFWGTPLTRKKEITHGTHHSATGASGSG